MQCARAIPVAWLGSGSCHNRPSGWILMMMTNDDDSHLRHCVSCGLFLSPCHNTILYAFRLIVEFCQFSSYSCCLKFVCTQYHVQNPLRYVYVLCGARQNSTVIQKRGYFGTCKAEGRKSSGIIFEVIQHFS